MPGPVNRDQQIEQALAWHRFAPAAYPQIRRELSVPQSEIDAAVARINEVAGQDDSTVRGNPGVHRNVQPCGTYAAYQRHRNRGEKPCEPCARAGWEHADRQAKGRGASGPARRGHVHSGERIALAG